MVWIKRTLESNVKNKLPSVSDAQLKEGMFIGLQIMELMEDKQFDEDLNETEKMHGCHSRGFARTSQEITK
jgi:hypothetical protein